LKSNRRQEGYLVITDPDGPLVEADTVQCRHCQRIVEVKPGTMAQVYVVFDVDGRAHDVAGAFCGSCFGPICLGCEWQERMGVTCERGSQHWERRLEQWERTC
jgi:hypothetical protein